MGKSPFPLPFPNYATPSIYSCSGLVYFLDPPVTTGFLSTPPFLILSGLGSIKVDQIGDSTFSINFFGDSRIAIASHHSCNNLQFIGFLFTLHSFVSAATVTRPCLGGSRTRCLRCLRPLSNSRLPPPPRPPPCSRRPPSRPPRSPTTSETSSRDCERGNRLPPQRLVSVRAGNKLQGTR